MKFTDEKYQRFIRKARTPIMVYQFGKMGKGGMNQMGFSKEDKEYYKKIKKFEGVKMRDDWDEIKETFMFKALKAKFDQNPDLKKKLMASKDQFIVEHTNRDGYWGDKYTNPDKIGNGKNRLGQLLMNLRYMYKISSTLSKFNLYEYNKNYI